MQPKLFSTVQKLSAVIFGFLIFKSDLAGFYFKNSGVKNQDGRQLKRVCETAVGTKRCNRRI